MPIYTTRQNTITINKEQLEDFLRQRGLEKIVLYNNYTFNNYDQESYTFIEHVWSHGDKLYKLAHHYYGNSGFFWIIAMFNNKPTDADYNYGDVILIPEDSRGFVREVTR